MSNTQPELEIEVADEGEAPSIKNDPDQAVVSALSEMIALLGGFQNTMNDLYYLQRDGKFKYLSKAARNELLSSILENAGQVEDSAKVVFRLLKKVRREHPPEDLVDALLSSYAHSFT